MCVVLRSGHFSSLGTTGLEAPPSSTRLSVLVHSSTLGVRSPSKAPQDIVQAEGMCGFWAHWLWQQHSASHRLLWASCGSTTPRFTPQHMESSPPPNVTPASAGTTQSHFLLQ